MSGIDLQRENGEAIRALAILATFFVAIAAGGYLYTMTWSAPFPRDGTSLVVGRDFLNFWMYGRAAPTADPSRFYDFAEYHRALEALLGPNYPGQNWSYPPSIFFIAAPFGQLDYLQALLVWTSFSATLFFTVARSHIGDTRLLIALLLSPAAVLCVISGQSSLITAAMLIAIFAWLDRRPVAAGILIGLLTLKPQLGILFPVMLIASARWRVFASATVTRRWHLWPRPRWCSARRCGSISPPRACPRTIWCWPIPIASRRRSIRPSS